MLSFIVYFLIFLIPGLFAVLVYNLLCRHKMDCFKTITSALLFDLFILGINLAGLRFIKGICTFRELQCSLYSLGFVSKYILLSLLVAFILGIIACLLPPLYCKCKERLSRGKKNDCKK